MAKKNCWEFKKCGREVGGINVGKQGICPAAINVEVDGFCEGKNGGRACVFVIGTLCDNVCQNTYEKKEKTCDACDFFALLKKEHPTEINIFTYFDYIQHKKGESGKK